MSMNKGQRKQWLDSLRIGALLAWSSSGSSGTTWVFNVLENTAKFIKASNADRGIVTIRKSTGKVTGYANGLPVQPVSSLRTPCVAK